jgi:hypothetical protein
MWNKSTNNSTWRVRYFEVTFTLNVMWQPHVSYTIHSIRKITKSRQVKYWAPGSPVLFQSTILALTWRRCGKSRISCHHNDVTWHSKAVPPAREFTAVTLHKSKIYIQVLEHPPPLAQSIIIIRDWSQYQKWNNLDTNLDWDISGVTLREI